MAYLRDAVFWPVETSSPDDAELGAVVVAHQLGAFLVGYSDDLCSGGGIRHVILHGSVLLGLTCLISGRRSSLPDGGEPPFRLVSPIMGGDMVPFRFPPCFLGFQ